MVGWELPYRWAYFLAMGTVVLNFLEKKVIIIRCSSVISSFSFSVIVVLFFYRLYLDSSLDICSICSFNCLSENHIGESLSEVRECPNIGQAIRIKVRNWWLYYSKTLYIVCFHFQNINVFVQPAILNLVN